MENWAIFVNFFSQILIFRGLKIEKFVKRERE